MVALNQMISSTGLRLETLQKVMQEYSSSINAIGAKKFTDALKISERSLIRLGFTNEEQADLVGAMVESMSNYEDMRGQSNAVIASRSLEFGSYLTRMSQQMGVSTDKLKQSYMEASKGTDAMLVMARLGPEAAGNFAQFTASIKDNNLKNVLATFASSQNPFATKEYQDIVKGAGAEVADIMVQSAKESVIDPAGAMKRVNERIAAISDGSILAMGIQQDAQNANASSALALVAAAKSQAFTMSQATEDQTQAAIDSQVPISRVKTEIEEFAATLQRAFPLVETQVTMLADVLEKTNDTINGQIGKFDMLDRSWTGVALAAMSALAGFTALKVLTGTVVNLIRSAVNPLNDIVNKKLKPMSAAKSLAARAGMVGAAGVAGYALGATVIAPLIDKGVSALTGNENDTLGGAIYDWINKDKNAELNAVANNTSKISSTKPTAMTTPAASTIDSPSVAKIKTDAPMTDSAATESPAPAASSPATRPGNDINSLMNAQKALLDQMLQETKNLVSVNKDMLRAIRTN
jgi:hypothetical protein